MKILKNKPLVTLINSSGKGAVEATGGVKLMAVTDADRQKLRIPTYQYLLP